MGLEGGFCGFGLWDMKFVNIGGRPEPGEPNPGSYSITVMIESNLNSAGVSLPCTNLQVFYVCVHITNGMVRLGRLG
jgi:hypothetical protein